MKVVVSAEGRELDSRVDKRFGRAAYLLVVDTDTLELEVIDNAPSTAAAQGAGIQAASAIAATPSHALISGNVGPKAFATLEKAGIPVYRCGDVSVRQAVAAFSRGELEQQRGASVKGHW
ncbi:MAG: NifB/NifX family molybdenum-iron cluster-binding protein [Spirochaetaceae bacterium]